MWILCWRTPAGSVVSSPLNSNFALCVRKGRKEGSLWWSASGKKTAAGYFCYCLYNNINRVYLLVQRKGWTVKMEADRSGGGPNPNSGGGVGSSIAGRNPNGPKAAPGQATQAATGAITAAATATTVGALPGSMPGPMPGSQPREPQDGDSGMTLPGILHFIQYEWGRFQAEKYRWEAERDELRVKISWHICICFVITNKVCRECCPIALWCHMPRSHFHKMLTG